MSYEIGKLIQGMSYEEYHEIPALRSSDLKYLKRSPAHWKYREQQKEPSEALEFGKIFHLALEDREKFIANMIIEPKVDLRTKIGKETLANFRANLQPGAIVIKPDWTEKIIGMTNSVLKHSRVGPMMAGGVSETSLVVKDPETGILLKCRPDKITERVKKNHLLDIKTTRNASRPFFLNQIFSDRGTSPFYILQAAHYVHCLRIAKILESESMTLIAIEKEPPYGIVVYPLDLGCLAVGEQWRAMLTAQYAKCLEEDTWPSYPEEILPISPPEWSHVPDMDEE